MAPKRSSSPGAGKKVVAKRKRAEKTSEKSSGPSSATLQIERAKPWAKPSPPKEVSPTRSKLESLHFVRKPAPAPPSEVPEGPSNSPLIGMGNSPDRSVSSSPPVPGTPTLGIKLYSTYDHDPYSLNLEQYYLRQQELLEATRDPRRVNRHRLDPPKKLDSSDSNTFSLSRTPTPQPAPPPAAVAPVAPSAPAVMVPSGRRQGVCTAWNLEKEVGFIRDDLPESEKVTCPSSSLMFTSHPFSMSSKFLQEGDIVEFEYNSHSKTSTELEAINVVMIKPATNRRRGKVSFFDTEKKFGFISDPELEKTNEGRVFLYHRKILTDNKTPKIGDLLEYRLEKNERGFTAEDIIEVFAPDAQEAREKLLNPHVNPHVPETRSKHISVDEKEKKVRFDSNVTVGVEQHDQIESASGPTHGKEWPTNRRVEQQGWQEAPQQFEPRPPSSYFQPQGIPSSAQQSYHRPLETPSPTSYPSYFQQQQSHLAPPAPQEHQLSPHFHHQASHSSQSQPSYPQNQSQTQPLLHFQPRQGDSHNGGANLIAVPPVHSRESSYLAQSCAPPVQQIGSHYQEPRVGSYGSPQGGGGEIVSFGGRQFVEVTQPRSFEPSSASAQGTMGPPPMAHIPPHQHQSVPVPYFAPSPSLQPYTVPTPYSQPPQQAFGQPDIQGPPMMQSYNPPRPAFIEPLRVNPSPIIEQPQFGRGPGAEGSFAIRNPGQAVSYSPYVIRASDPYWSLPVNSVGVQWTEKVIRGGSGEGPFAKHPAWN